MRRRLILSLLLLALVGCGRRVPPPTGSPTATPTETAAPVPSFTAKPQASPLPRITVVPSATRLPVTATPTSGPVTPVPTGTPLPSPTGTSMPTPTQPVINAGPTDTPSPTASTTPPLPESPLPTPTQATPTPVPSGAGEPSPVPSATAVADAGSTATATPETPAAGSATPTQETPGAASATPTQTSEPQGEAWALDGVLTYYDEFFSELYVWGAVVNESDAHWRLTTLMPVVYDAQGDSVTSEADVDYFFGYDELLAALSLAPGQSLAFSFIVSLPEDFAYRDQYEILVEGSPAEPSRDDLDIVQDDFDDGDWPFAFYVEGMYENPGPDLSDYVAIVVTLYDVDERVIGVGWQYETDPYFFGPGENPFEVAVEIQEVIPEMELEVYSYHVQVFGN